jgi:TIR domain
MGYLRDYGHDIFVSYAHSDPLKEWCACLIKETRELVANGLGLRQGEQVGLWWDHRISGNAHLSDQLREEIERSGLLLVLMSDLYLQSTWCRDELQWFVDTVARMRSARRIFVVRIRSTDAHLWPSVFKDDRGHPLIGYDFVRDVEDDNLGVPKGFPRPECAPDSKEYYAALGKLASDLVGQLKAIQTPRPTKGGLSEPPAPPIDRANADRAVTPPRLPPRPTPASPQERVFLAAAPAEDVDDLRDQLSGLLRARGYAVVPDDNPRCPDEIHARAPEWIANCDKFVQVLGSLSGTWRHDDIGFVMYQHRLAGKHKKPTFVYRAPTLEMARVKRQEYRGFIESCNPSESDDLDSFVKNLAASSRESRSVFIMTGPRDESLDQEIRSLLRELKVGVFPFARHSCSVRDVASIVDERRGFLNTMKRCDAVLLLHGNVKEEDYDWIEQRVLDIDEYVKPKLGRPLPFAIIDAPPPPRLEACDEPSVLLRDSPSFIREIRDWLDSLDLSGVVLREACHG